MKPTILILLAALAVSGCHKIHEGKVIEKYIVPAHNEEYYTTMYVNNMPIMQYHDDHYPESYWIKLQKDSIVEDFSIELNDWNKIQIGDYDTIK